MAWATCDLVLLKSKIDSRSARRCLLLNPEIAKMSTELGSVRGHRHPIIVSRSDAGVELGIWNVHGLPNGMTGIGDGMTPDAARGLAALLNAAADDAERRTNERLAKTER